MELIVKFVQKWNLTSFPLLIRHGRVGNYLTILYNYARVNSLIGWKMFFMLNSTSHYSTIALVYTTILFWKEGKSRTMVKWTGSKMWLLHFNKYLS